MKLFENQNMSADSKGRADQSGLGAAAGAVPEGRQSKVANAPRGVLRAQGR